MPSNESCTTHSYRLKCRRAHLRNRASKRTRRKRRAAWSPATVPSCAIFLVPTLLQQNLSNNSKFSNAKKPPTDKSAHYSVGSSPTFTGTLIPGHT